MRYALTKFRSIFDKHTRNRVYFSSWGDFETFLYKYYQLDGKKYDKDKSFEENKNCTPLVSPAVYREAKGRKNDNVICWDGWACLDVDDYEGDFKELMKKFKSKGHYFTYYNTASSTPEKPKFRLVFPLTCELPNKDIKQFWYALNTEFESAGDRQTKDLSRLFYLPAQYPGAYTFFGRVKGRPIDPYKLIEKHPMPRLPDRNSGLSPELVEKLAEYRKNKLKPSPEWSHYTDCPYVSKKLVAEYKSITESGWYHKLYTIMCAAACRAMEDGYSITPTQLADIARQIDAETGAWYKNRPLEVEAGRALEYALTSNI